MRKLVVTLLSAVAASIVAGGAGSAADLPAKIPLKAPAPVAPVANWAGLYAGVFGGYGWGDHDRLNTNNFANSYSSGGGLFGGLLGYNWQLNTWVLGLEGDLAWAGITGDDNWTGGSNDETKFRWLSTVRGRAGYLVAPNWLLYATGGAAFADLKHSNIDPAGTDTASWTRTGWTVGAGVEYAFLGNWSARLDYRYYDFGSYTRTPANGNAAFTVDNTLQTVTAGIVYRFGTLGARY